MITINELWKDVRNFEGEYQVSTLGNFKSLPKKIWNGHGFYISKERIIKPYKTKKGYLHIDFRTKTLKAHRIVAETFIQQAARHVPGHAFHKAGKPHAVFVFACDKLFHGGHILFAIFKQ